MVTVLEVLGRYEPLWLFLVLFVELLCGIYVAVYMKKEYDYDKEKDERKSVRIRKNKKGQLTITQQSSGVDVSIENAPQ